RIEYIKSKLEKSNIQVKELEDYFNQKLFGHSYSDWENQIYLENQDEKGNTFLTPEEIEFLLEEIRNTSENGLEEFFSTHGEKSERRNLKFIIKKRKEFRNIEERIEQMVRNEDFYEEEIKALITRLKKLID
ncbi:31403_t:CDS:2, partial [Racocetra persica]